METARRLHSARGELSAGIRLRARRLTQGGYDDGPKVHPQTNGVAGTSNGNRRSRPFPVLRMGDPVH